MHARKHASELACMQACLEARQARAHARCMEQRISIICARVPKKEGARIDRERASPKMFLGSAHSAVIYTARVGLALRLSEIE